MLMKWLMGDDAAPAGSATTPTPQTGSAVPLPPAPSAPAPSSSAPIPPPAPQQPKVLFVQPQNATPPPPARPMPSAPMPTPPPTPPVAPPAPTEDKEEKKDESQPETEPSLPQPIKEAAKDKDDVKEDKIGTIEVSDHITSEDPQLPSKLFEQALEATGTPVENKEEKEEEVKIERPTPPTTMFPPVNPAPPSQNRTQSNSSLSPDADLPDVSSEIKRILQERWITLAHQQIDSLAKRRDEIAAQLAELEVQQRELNTKKQGLENERVEVLHASEGWNAKMGEAQTTLDKVVQEVSAIS